jgi:hypothetical protein
MQSGPVLLLVSLSLAEIGPVLAVSVDWVVPGSVDWVVPGSA